MDTTYGIDGEARHETSTPLLTRSLVAHAEGAVIAAAQTGLDAHPTGIVVRFTPSGALDETYGEASAGLGAGTAVLDFGGRASDIEDLALLDDGGALVLGTTHNGLNPTLWLAKLTRDGHLDDSFGASGRVIIGEDSGYGQGHRVACTSERFGVVARNEEGLHVREGALDGSKLSAAASPEYALPFANALSGLSLLADLNWSSASVDTSSTSRLVPFEARQITIGGDVSARLGAPPAFFVRAEEIVFEPNAVLRAEGIAGDPPDADVQSGNGGNGGSGGGAGGDTGYAGYGGRYGFAGYDFGAVHGGVGFAESYAHDFFFGVGGAGGAGKGCCPPWVLGGEAANGGGGGGGGLIVLVAQRISGPGRLAVRGGGSQPVFAIASGGGGGGVIWIATAEYDGQLTADVSGGSASTFQRGYEGLARIFQIHRDGTLEPRTFDATWGP